MRLKFVFCSEGMKAIQTIKIIADLLLFLHNSMRLLQHIENIYYLFY